MTEYIVEVHGQMPDAIYERNVGEIVRCKDCKHGHEVYWPANSGIPDDYLDCTGELVETWDYYNDCPKDNPVKPDGFCAWYERKNDAE